MNKSKPKNPRRKFKTIDYNNNNKEDKFTYLTTTNEIQSKKENKNNVHYSIDNKNRRKYNYNDYSSNEAFINHPMLYILNNKRKNKKNNLPMINIRCKKININENLCNIDNIALTKEEKINKFDEYMKIKELKELKKI